MSPALIGTPRAVNLVIGLSPMSRSRHDDVFADHGEGHGNQQDLYAGDRAAQSWAAWTELLEQFLPDTDSRKERHQVAEGQRVGHLPVI